MKTFLKSLLVSGVIFITSLHADFITTWETNSTDQNISLGIYMTTDGNESTTQWFLVNWGDNGSDMNITTDGTKPSHIYANIGEYNITIVSNPYREANATVDELPVPKLTLNLGDATNKTFLKSVVSFDANSTIEWKTYANAFSDCINLDYNSTDPLPLSDDNSTVAMFKNVKSVNGISGWNTTNIVDMNSMFIGVKNFNEDLSAWDTAKVTNMSYMFNTVKDSNLSTMSTWDTSSVTDMSSMFSFTEDSNLTDANTTDTTLPNISSWDTTNVTNMQDMFKNSGFDEDLSAWDTKISNVTNMSGLFGFSRISKVNLISTLGSWSAQNDNNATIDIGKKVIEHPYKPTLYVYVNNNAISSYVINGTTLDINSTTTDDGNTTTIYTLNSSESTATYRISPDDNISIIDINNSSDFNISGVYVYPSKIGTRYILADDTNVTLTSDYIKYTDYDYNDIAPSLKSLSDNNWKIVENGTPFEDLKLDTQAFDANRTTFENEKPEDFSDTMNYQIYSALSNNRNGTRTVQYAISDYNSTLISLVVSDTNNTEIDANTFNDSNQSIIYYRLKPNQNGISHIDVNVTDGYFSDSGTFDLNISAVPDAPTIDLNISASLTTNGTFNINNKTITLQEGNSSFTFDLNVTDVDGDTITYAISTSTNSILSVSIDSNGVVTVNPKNINDSGNADIKITAITDDNNVSQTFHVNIQGVNDAPVFGVTTLSDITLVEDNGTTTYDVNVTDADGDSLSVTVESNNTLILTVDKNWQNRLTQASWNNQMLDFNLTTVKDAYGKVRITMMVSDSELNTTISKDVIVSPVYDIFTIANESARYYVENFSPKVINLDLTLNDTNQSDINYSVVLSNSLITLEVNDTTNIVSLHSVNGETGSTDVNITATDVNNTEVKVDFIINVGIDANLNHSDNSLTSTLENTDTTIASSDLNVTVEPVKGLVSYTDGTTSLESNISTTAEVVSVLKKSGKEQKIISQINGADTNLSKDSNGGLQIRTTFGKLVSTLKEDGSTQNSITNAGKASISKTDINGSVTTIDANGNIQLYAGEVINGDYFVKGLISTKSNGEITTRLVKVLITDENNITDIGKTISETTPYSAGTVSEIIMIGGKVYLINKTTLTDNLKVQ